MRYCSNCGSELPENAKFCSLCGTEFQNGKDEPKNTFKLSYLIALVLLGMVVVVGGIIVGKIYKNVKYKNLVSQSEVYIIDQNYVDAEKNCQEAMELFPERPESYIYLAKVCEKTHRKEAALENYEKALSFDVAAVDAYKGIIAIYVDNDYMGSEILEVVEEAINQISEDELTDFIKMQQFLNQLCRIESYQNYMNTVDKQGGVSKSNQYVIGTLGMSFAKLLDMNNDDLDELVVVYAKSEHDIENIPVSIDDYVVEVCAYENKQLNRVYTGTPLVTGSNTKEIVLLQTDGIWKLVKDEKQITSEAQVYVLQGEMGQGTKLAYNEMEETKTLLDYKNHAIRASIQNFLSENKKTEDIVIPVGNYANANQGIYLVSKIDENNNSIIELYFCEREDPFSHHNKYVLEYNKETKNYGYEAPTDYSPKADVYLKDDMLYVDFESYVTSANSEILVDNQIGTVLYVDEEYDF